MNIKPSIIQVYLYSLVLLLGFFSSCTNTQTQDESWPTEDEAIEALASDSSFIEKIKEDILFRQLLAAGEIKFGKKDIYNELLNATSEEEQYEIMEKNMIKGGKLYVELQRNSKKYSDEIAHRFRYMYEADSPFDLEALDRISLGARKIVETEYAEAVEDIKRIYMSRWMQKHQD